MSHKKLTSICMSITESDLTMSQYGLLGRKKDIEMTDYSTYRVDQIEPLSLTFIPLPEQYHANEITHSYNIACELFSTGALNASNHLKPYQMFDITNTYLSERPFSTYPRT